MEVEEDQRGAGRIWVQEEEAVWDDMAGMEAERRAGRVEGQG